MSTVPDSTDKPQRDASGRCPDCGHHKRDTGDSVPIVCIGHGSMCPCQRRSDRSGLYESGGAS